MKKLFQKSGSLLMALLVLFSTMSFTVDKHFCGDYLVDQSVFSEAQSCGMEHEPGMAEAGGCEDQKIVIEGQDELKASFDSLNIDQQLFLNTFAYSYLNIFEGLPQQIVPFKNYTPPLLVSDIQLLGQSFLI